MEENTKFFETEKKLFDYGLSIANFELVYDISHLNQGYLAVGIFSGRVVPITYYYEDKVQYLVFTINGSDLIKINK